MTSVYSEKLRQDEVNTNEKNEHYFLADILKHYESSNALNVSPVSDSGPVIADVLPHYELSKVSEKTKNESVFPLHSEQKIEEEHSGKEKEEVYFEDKEKTSGQNIEKKDDEGISEEVAEEQREISFSGETLQEDEKSNDAGYSRLNEGFESSEKSIELMNEIEELKNENERLSIENEKIKKEYTQKISDLDLLKNEYASSIEKIKELYRKLEPDFKKDFVDLFDLLMDRIFKTETSLNKKHIEIFVNEAFAALGNTEHAVIYVNPEDYDFLQSSEFGRLISESDTVKLEPDETVSMGGCMVESRAGCVDNRIETKLERVRNLIVAEIVGKGE